jgi:hypothetical protein
MRPGLTVKDIHKDPRISEQVVLGSATPIQHDAYIMMVSIQTTITVSTDKSNNTRYLAASQGQLTYLLNFSGDAASILASVRIIRFRV